MSIIKAATRVLTHSLNIVGNVAEAGDEVSQIAVVASRGYKAITIASFALPTKEEVAQATKTIEEAPIVFK